MKQTNFHLSLLMSCLLLAGCQSVKAPEQPDVMASIQQQMQQAEQQSEQVAAVPVPEAVNQALLPPLTIPLPEQAEKQLEPRFDLSVNKAPADQVFMGIVNGTRYSMLLHPDVSGEITVNLKDVTVLEALDSLRDLYGYEYKVEGNRILVSRAGIQTRIYKVNYIVGLRRGRSDIVVTAGGSGGSSGGSSGSTSGSSSGGSSGASSAGSSQASSIESSQEADFWQEITQSVEAVLACPSSASGSAAAVSSSTGAATNAGASGGVSANASCSGSKVLVNPMSGTVIVQGMPDKLRIVDEVLATMQANVERQVILEAKIIDVELNSGAQQGINWSEFRHGAHHLSAGASVKSLTESSGNGGLLKSGTTLGDFLGSRLTDASGSAFSSGLGLALQVNNFSALISFLETQGQVNVLSSPRISTINNQKAVLKIGRDEQYVTGFEQGASSATTSVGSTVNNQPTPSYSTFFSGISLDVTPQIDENGMITLHVHPLVSEVTEVMKQTINNAFLPFASNKISETDSVVKVQDGQIVVIGGLMTESNLDNNERVIGLGRLPIVGPLFRKLKQGSNKRELVIMLKPTVVRNNGAWLNDIAATRQRLEQLGKQP